MTDIQDAAEVARLQQELRLLTNLIELLSEQPEHAGIVVTRALYLGEVLEESSQALSTNVGHIVVKHLVENPPMVEDTRYYLNIKRAELLEDYYMAEDA